MSVDTSGGHSAMDYNEHDRTYLRFLRISKYGIIAIIALLALMAYFLV